MKCVSELLSDSFCLNLFVLVVCVWERRFNGCLFSEQNCLFVWSYSWLCVCVFLVLYVFVDVSSGRLALGVHVSRTADRPCSSGSEMREKEGGGCGLLCLISVCACASVWCKSVGVFFSLPSPSPFFEHPSHPPFAVTTHSSSYLSSRLFFILHLFVHACCLRLPQTDSTLASLHAPASKPHRKSEIDHLTQEDLWCRI